MPPKTDLFADKRPISWLSYHAMPNPDPVYQVGCPDGYQRFGLYDTLKPEYPVSNFDKRTTVTGMEKESGVSRTFEDPKTGRRWTVMNKLDIRYAQAFGGLAAVMADIRLTSAQAKETVKAADARLEKHVPFGYYSLPIFNPGDNEASFRNAVKAATSEGIGEYADFFFIDAHPNSNQDLAVWKGKLDVNHGVYQEFCPKKPMVVVMLDQWAHGALQFQWVRGDAIIDRIRYARAKKGVWTMARMGGYDNKGPRGWRTLPWGSHPDNTAISKALGV